jgi:hypothetical protein
MSEQQKVGNAAGEATEESDITGEAPAPDPGGETDLAEAAGGGGNATGGGLAGDRSTLAGADAKGQQGDDDFGRGGD